MVADRPEVSPTALLVYVPTGLVIVGTAGMSPVLPALAAEFRLADGEVGLAMTLFTLPVVFTVALLGWLADRVGRGPVLGWSLLLFGAAGGLTYLAGDFRTVLALRVLQGVGFSGVVPLVVTLVGDLFEGADEVGAQGIRVTFVNLGAALFPVLTGALVGPGWNVPFLLYLLAVPTGLAVLGWLPEPTRGEGAGGTNRADGIKGTNGADRTNEAKGTNGAERTDRAGSPDTGGGGYLGAVLAAARAPVVLVAVGVGTVRFFAIYGLYTFLPLLAVARGLGAAEAGLAVGAINGARMLVATGARRSLSLGAPRHTAVGSLLAGGVVLVGYVLAGSLPAFLAVGVAFGAVDGVTAPLQKTVLTRYTPRSVRAGVVSLNAAVQNVGKTLAPVVVGAVVAATALPTAFALLGSGAAAAAALLAGVLVATGTPDTAAGTAAD